ncbi:MAG: DUF4910 domain-containing protein [Lachnospiraceae bacterium]|nr:DUF4910 domain-containing protein [Lachnospiraceae bacterium]
MSGTVNDGRDIGREMYDLAGKIFPICRSITGNGVRETFRILDEYIAEDGIRFNIVEVPSGTKVLDWTVPKEWAIRAAYIEDEGGNRIIDMNDNNLHVLGYSIPVDKWVTLDELKECVYTQPDQPDVIPYVTSYYKERYGFCMSQRQLDSLPEGKYHLYIDSSLFDGSLTYAEAVIPGETDEELMITSYSCHPSMANDECSGMVVVPALIRYVQSMKNRRYTYRFLLNPETIGALTYLSFNMDHLKAKLKAGVVFSCVGDDRDYSIIHTRYGNTLADRSLTSVIRGREHYSEYTFRDRGSDERQYNAPGIDLPVVSFCRTKHDVFPEYHTSADNMDMISPEGLYGTYEVMVQWIQCMEANGKYKITVLGEPQLGKRGLYPTVAQKTNYDGIMVMRDIIAYADGTNDLFDLSAITGVPPYEMLPIIKSLTENGLMTAEEMVNI